MTKIQVVDLKIKAAGVEDGLQEGEFIGYASVFGNVDRHGDVVIQGAFTETLSEWKASGEALSVLWGHDMRDPFSNVGEAVEYTEDEHGLKIHGALDLENPTARQVYRLIKGRRVNQMSFAYDVLDGAWVETRDPATGKMDGYYELRKLKLHEVSIVPIGANSETELLVVKSDEIISGLKAGRVLSSKNEGILKDAHQELTAAAKRIGDVLAQVASTDEEKAITQPEAKDKELPQAAKSEEQPDEVPVDSESDEDSAVPHNPVETDEDGEILDQLEFLQLGNFNGEEVFA